MADATNTTRRAVLKAAPALAALAAPSAAGAAAPSPLRSLYFEWQATKDRYACTFDDPDGPASLANFAQMLAMEEVAEAFVPTTTEDFAFKVIFANDDDDGGDRHQMALVEMSYALVGITPRKGRMSAEAHSYS